MLITLCYVYMWVRFHKCYSVLISNSLLRRRSSKRSSCFSFLSSSASAPPPGLHRPSALEPEDTVFLQLGDKTVCVTEPQACDDLSKWTVLLGSSLGCSSQVENISFIIEAAGPKVGFPPPPAADKKVVKWSDYCSPLACSPDQPFRAVAQASVDNFSLLGVAFIEDRLQLDNGLVPSRIIPVLLQECTLSKLLEKQCLQNPKTERTGFRSQFLLKPFPPPHHHYLPADQQHLQCRKGSLLLIPAVSRQEKERRGSEPLLSTQGLGNSKEHCLEDHQHMEGHGLLHLSSCHECLELESSTILSVKHASAENIPDLPDDSSVGLDSVDGCAELELDASYDCKNKSPNVLVYTGGCQERFQAIQQLLLECINVENNIIYPLLPQQAQSDPWLDNTRLLVLAEEDSLTPELQTCFLTYLSQGGKVLGLGSTLCPAGLHLEARVGSYQQIRRLIFTREDSTELNLSILACENVYVRDPQEGGEVELWGELKSEVPHQREMVIVRVTHGADNGEAVLCQVHFHMGPDSQSLDSENVDEFKANSALRYEILTEILTSLGLTCEPNQTPAPSPVYLLATSQEAKTIFLKFLQTQADPSGLVKFFKTPFRMVTSSELHDGPSQPEGCLALVTESRDMVNFSIETYCKNLKTSHLGHTVLYAETATSTMDLLEGFMLHLPQDVGIIAVASQQTQGKGRGRNAWLSPVGCAMFTVRVQVELHSRLGQRIPFLQHLAALAIVEAVCTLPGYQVSSFTAFFLTYLNVFFLPKCSNIYINIWLNVL
uniref:Holocarboxylase synthetase (Biotin-(Proprionyl-Coenzyme A-carboxylase (ATP-hydrolysing)) ligase) n=1 Tax=Iconisemion striatum TaxID=60296 RepID=A0A1A7WYW9_9TELE